MVQTEGPQMTSQYDAYALHAGLARVYARMRMHTFTRKGNHMHARTRKHAHTDQQVIMLFHGNNNNANAPQCYIIRTLPHFLQIVSECVVIQGLKTIHSRRRYTPCTTDSALF